MKIHKVYSVQCTQDDCLLIDMDYTGIEGDVRANVAYRASDPYSLLTPLITQWLSDNPHQILPYVPPLPPTPEELRELMPFISKRQLRLTLVRNDVSLAELDAAILAMGDEAIIEWQDASEYKRLHPLLNQVAAFLSLSQEQVDIMWEQALTA